MVSPSGSDLSALLACIETEADGGAISSREVTRRLGYRSPRSGHLRILAWEEPGLLARDRGPRRLRLSEEARLAVAVHSRGEGSLVPLLGRVAAGSPVFVPEHAESVIEIDRATIRARGPLFAMRVVGDSMTGDGILPGDLVVVRHQPTIQPGEIAVVAIGDEATVKRVYPRRDHLELRSSNPKYKPRRVSLGGGEGVSIAGKVVSVIRPKVM